MSFGEHSRGYLPHLEGAEYQAITYRLADSLPQQVLERIRQERHQPTRKRITEQELDRGYGQCWLAKPDIAAMVIGNWRHFDGVRYQLLAYVVMPNHVHVLIRVFPGFRLSSIVHGWKSYTAQVIGAHIMQSSAAPRERIWQPEYWDRYIRDQAHFDRVVEYIHRNPVKAGLVAHEKDWRWSSAYEDGARAACPLIGAKRQPS
ncbi:REP-associated tyrosine transposase [Oceanimonas marisflavi]|uniref:REP-associated tyrosine transposase n=1 Tax=Oceanimonas marisflavi TaxID=2059724 RepID=UPI0018E5810C|nr:transposase [Oceanimonas marisflavi]